MRVHTTEDEETAREWWSEIDLTAYTPSAWCHGLDVKFIDAWRGFNEAHGYDWVRLTYRTKEDGREFHKLARNPPYDEAANQ